MERPGNLEGVRQCLLGLLQEHEILSGELLPEPWNRNLFDLALIDSMGAVHMLELISEKFGVEIDPDILVGELTTLDAICGYILDRQRRL